jgi:phosphoesterase RecJ-like protein
VSGLDDVVARVRAGQRFLVTAHANPDGDALGSMLATLHGLRALGKDVVAYDHDRAPKRLAFLPGAQEIVTNAAKLKGRFDATLVHDCGDAKLLGENFPPPTVTGPLIVLDHHASARPFGEVVWRDATAAAVGVMIGRLLRALDVTLTREMAECLWCSLVSDTGWFRYSATDVETMQLATACVAAGAVPWQFARHSEEESSPRRLKLLARVLETLELDGPAALLTLTQAMLQATGASYEMGEGMVNYARGLEGVEVGIMLYEVKGGVRVSLRSKGGLDVGAVAGQFGGGGHRAAAGCFIAGSVDEAKQRLRVALKVAAEQP